MRLKSVHKTLIWKINVKFCYQNQQFSENMAIFSSRSCNLALIFIKKCYKLSVVKPLFLMKVRSQFTTSAHLSPQVRKSGYITTRKRLSFPPPHKTSVHIYMVYKPGGAQLFFWWVCTVYGFPKVGSREWVFLEKWGVLGAKVLKFRSKTRLKSLKLQNGGTWAAHWWLIGRLGSTDWPEKRGSWLQHIPIPPF